ncbi:hypothetical protein RQP46_004036 [Phenoliferia psychrophenolica]
MLLGFTLGSYSPPLAKIDELDAPSHEWDSELDSWADDSQDSISSSFASESSFQDLYDHRPTSSSHSSSLSPSSSYSSLVSFETSASESDDDAPSPLSSSSDEAASYRYDPTWSSSCDPSSSLPPSPPLVPFTLFDRTPLPLPLATTSSSSASPGRRRTATPPPAPRLPPRTMLLPFSFSTLCPGSPPPPYQATQSTTTIQREEYGLGLSHTEDVDMDAGGRLQDGKDGIEGISRGALGLSIGNNDRPARGWSELGTTAEADDEDRRGDGATLRVTKRRKTVLGGR